MGSITNKINKKIEVIASILGAIGLIYLSYPMESNIKRILLNPFFQITWLLIIVWIYNSFNRHIAMIMGILFVGMRVFLKGKFIENFENNKKNNEKNNKKNNEKNIKTMNKQSKIKLAQLQLDKSKYPLAIQTILEIQDKYPTTDLKLLKTQDIDTLGKYTPEQYPENVGLPKPVAKNDLDYSKLVKENKVIEFK